MLSLNAYKSCILYEVYMCSIYIHYTLRYTVYISAYAFCFYFVSLQCDPQKKVYPILKCYNFSTN